MVDYGINIGPYQWKGLAGGWGVNIGLYQGNVAPEITGQSPDQSGYVGDVVTLWITATGSPIPSYQWYFGSTLLPGETNSSLSVTVGYGTDGSYKCVATNVVGSVESGTIHVMVIDGARIHLFEIPSDLSTEDYS